MRQRTARIRCRIAASPEPAELSARAGHGKPTRPALATASPWSERRYFRTRPGGPASVTIGAFDRPNRR